MRTALVLLFLLAVASVPGSVLPQRGNNPLRVDQWLTNNPTAGPILDRLGFFDGYSSPWFSSVYLLLFLSLIGCLLPRCRQHWRAVRSQPPPAPRRLTRLPGACTLDVGASPQEVLDRAERHLRRGRWRLRPGGDDDGAVWLAAERGYLHETGNLVFHLSLLLVLGGVAIGGLFGWKGNVIVREGSGFSNTLTQYDAWGGGRFVNPDDLSPFSFQLDDFTVDFERGDAQAGAPRLFEADLTYRPSPEIPPPPSWWRSTRPSRQPGRRYSSSATGMPRASSSATAPETSSSMMPSSSCPRTATSPPPASSRFPTPSRRWHSRASSLRQRPSART
ncbi:MAG: cytochrome c biogenesis protein ResB [Actinobacteria bacterium]|nr:cytochrome c biogenesis protein ResB [Actinomycetota bacterium]